MRFRSTAGIGAELRRLHKALIMKKIPAFCCLILYFGVLLPASIQAQKRPLEKEVLVEKVFIDATREKILGNIDDAAYLFSEVIEKDRNNHAAYYELAQLYENSLSRREGALQKARKAVELSPTNIYYTAFYAEVLNKDGQPRKAADAYEELVKHHPENEDLYHQWSEYLRRADRPDLAIKAYNAWEKEGGTREVVYQRRFEIYQEMGKRNKAESEMEALLEAHPNQISYLQKMADFYESWDKKDKALEMYRRILKVDETNAKANIALADIYKEQGDELQYLKALRGLFNDPNQNLEAKINVMVPYLNRLAKEGEAHPDEELKALEAVLMELADILAEQHPNEGRAQVLEAEMLFYTEQYKPALRKFEEALEIEKSQFSVWEKTMLLADKLGDSKRLNALSKEAIELYPNQPTPYYFQGQAALQIEQAQPALRYFVEAEKRAFGQQELKAKIQSGIGTAQQMLSRYQESDAAFEKAIELSPRDPSISYAYSLALIDRNEELPKVVDMLEKLLEKQPQNPKYNAARGRALYQQKDYKAARDWYDKALRYSNETDASILEQYGDLLYRLDEKERAVLYWQKAQDAGADSAVLEQKISTKKLYE